MTELQPLFHIEGAPDVLTQRERLIAEYKDDLKGASVDDLIAIREVELDTLSDSEARIQILNEMIGD